MQLSMIGNYSVGKIFFFTQIVTQSCCGHQTNSNKKDNGCTDASKSKFKKVFSQLMCKW